MSKLVYQYSTLESFSRLISCSASLLSDVEMAHEEV